MAYLYHGGGLENRQSPRLSKDSKRRSKFHTAYTSLRFEIGHLMAILQIKKEKGKEGGRVARALLERDAKQVILSPTDTHQSSRPGSSSKSNMTSVRAIKQPFDPSSSSTGSVDGRYGHMSNKQMYQSQTTHNPLNHCIESSCTVNQEEALCSGAQSCIPLYNGPTPQRIAGSGSGEGLPYIVSSDYPTKAIDGNSGRIKSPPEAPFCTDDTVTSYFDYFDCSEDETPANHRHALGHRISGIKDGNLQDSFRVTFSVLWQTNTKVNNLPRINLALMDIVKIEALKQTGQTVDGTIVVNTADVLAIGMSAPDDTPSMNSYNETRDTNIYRNVALGKTRIMTGNVGVEGWQKMAGHKTTITNNRFGHDVGIITGDMGGEAARGLNQSFSKREEFKAYVRVLLFIQGFHGNPYNLSYRLTEVESHYDKGWTHYH
ncbi:hypothetical protein FoTM2_017760 [Fusarium oxysporum f. sp. vasinfectum]|nr:hypothetical protein FoTM2_017760 [Fusarium oxysporum f. sp. vasinfectum]